MLRTRVLNEQGKSYICASCQRQLSSQARPARYRHAPNIARSRTLGVQSLVHAEAGPNIRLFSSTEALRDGPGKKFPHGGSFGVPGAFGSFASRNTTPNTAPGSALLPHELEARRKAELVKEQEDQARLKAAQEKEAREKAAQEKVARHAERNMRGNGNQAQANSHSALADVLKRQRAPRTSSPNAPSRLSPGSQTSQDLHERISGTKPESGATKSTGPTPAASGWGSFSQRSAKLTNADSLARPAPKPTPRPDMKSKGKELAFKASIQSKRADPNSATTTSAPGDFWDELEQRVTGMQSQDDKRRRSRPSQGQAGTKAEEYSGQASVAQTTPSTTRPPKTGATPEQIRSRYDGDMRRSNDRGDRRSKKPKKGGWDSRNGRDDDWEMSDEDVERWERQQQRKAEKLAAKQQAAFEPEAIPIFIPEYINVANLAQALKQRPTSFLNDLEEMGFEDMTQDTIMTGETAALVAAEYGFEPTVDTGSVRDLRPRPAPEDPSALPACPPVVTIMGHVDHGKTTLLDWLRKSSIAAQEHGGITQHIGAFVVKLSSGKTITFLDTPGHAAFLSMRQRGANVTDIVVLVVAADDSVMPQTIEALKHARAAKVPIIVAISKVDKEDARVDQVKADLSRNGVEIEDFGGDVQVVCVSGKTGQGMEDLEENIVTLSEVLDTRAETDGMAEGWILESNVKQDGKAATVLVKRGTLRLGDIIVAGKTWGRIRLMRNEAGMDITEAAPGTPVEILGWRDLPVAGEQILQSPDENGARTAVDYRQEMAEREESSRQLAEQEQRQREKAAAEAAAAEAASAAEAGEDDGPAVPGLIKQNFVIKADAGGSVEAICGAVQEVGSNEVQPRILRSSTGQIFEADIDHAAASKSIIINFNSTIQPHIKQLAAAAKVKILDHTVIYHIVDDVKSALSDLLPMNVSARVIGEADILQIFSINVKKRVFQNIAGCKVRNGTIRKASRVRVLRKGEIIHDGKIDTLKHVKKDVNEMGKGSECGIGLEGFEEFQIDDQVQTYEVVKEKRYL